ncbi:MAG TPA: sodium:calcium antiporter, partial [Candidatus Pacearchaeota archaeon]|nr:sodium:calcium antiporter [Candidatus Pacearchaeota archaeon]
MIWVNLILFLLFLAILIKTADYAIKYSSRIARTLRLPEFIVSFFIVALISVLPEATIAIISAIEGEPSMSLGTLFGANIADLTLVFGVVTLFSFNKIRVRSKILNNNFFYLIVLIFPLVLGLDGIYSRADGIILILTGILFYVKVYAESRRLRKKFNHAPKGHLGRDLLLLAISLGVIIFAASFTVKYSVGFAQEIKIPTVLIGITIIAVGTCLPELIFSIKAIKENKDDLALGDVLGTVITDTTIILGLVALISPFNYNLSNLYVTGGARLLGGIIVTLFMKSEKSLSKLEGLLLVF